jgi:hypothetical protein
LQTVRLRSLTLVIAHSAVLQRIVLHSCYREVVALSFSTSLRLAGSYWAYAAAVSSMLVPRGSDWFSLPPPTISTVRNQLRITKTSVGHPPLCRSLTLLLLWLKVPFDGSSTVSTRLLFFPGSLAYHLISDFQALVQSAFET